MRGRKYVCVCVCVYEKERESVCVCVYICVYGTCSPTGCLSILLLLARYIISHRRLSASYYLLITRTSSFPGQYRETNPSIHKDKTAKTRKENQDGEESGTLKEQERERERERAR